MTGNPTISDDYIHERVWEGFPAIMELLGVISLIAGGLNSVTGGSMDYSIGFLLMGLVGYSISNSIMIHRLKKEVSEA